MDPVWLLLIGALVVVAGAVALLLRRGGRRATAPTVALWITPHAAERMAAQLAECSQNEKHLRCS